jgi:hypothetical protein
MSTPTPDPWRSRWAMPVVCLAIGAMIFAAFAIGDKPGEGVGALVLFVVIAAVFAFGAHRSDTIGGLGGPRRDERWEGIDLRATAFSGLVLIGIVLGSWLVEIAQARTASRTRSSRPSAAWPTRAATAWLRWRS